MFSFIGYALLMNRKGLMVNSVAWSILFILLLGNPYLLFQAGFQMSYLALLGILIFFPKFNALWKFRFPPLQKLLELSWVSLSAQLGVLPLSLYYFHQFPGVFLLANLSILPFLGLILGLGFLVLVLSVLECLPDLLLQFYQAMLNLWLNWARILGDWELFHFRDIPFQSWQLLLGYGLLGSAGYYLYYRRQKVLWVCLTFVFSWIVLTHYNAFNSSAKEELFVLNRYRRVPWHIEGEGC
jgi:competence protein ComEC